LRGVIVIPANYYYALPIWTGWTPEKAMSMLPWWIIFSLNAIQGILEVTVAWLLVFKFKLKRFATWKY
jgi:riboflavin transporter FmnP